MTMHANLDQLNRVAILLDDSESVLARLDATETHRMDGTIIATVDGHPYIIDRDGQLVSAADHVEKWLGLTVAA
jgi:peroxiredoxin